jgi:hypothetical protein
VPVACVPSVGWLPAQAPEAMQAVALLACQVSLELAPLLMVLGAALMLICGALATVTVADCEVAPPGPEQDSE